MSLRPAVAALAVTLVVTAAQAAKLDKEGRKWLEGVAAIILPEERKVYEALEDRGSRLEFERIFWARRDPDLATPENEFQAEFGVRKAEADARFPGSAEGGSATGCGRLLILLGEPDRVEEEATGTPLGSGAPPGWMTKGVERSAAHQSRGFPKRNPHIWTYRDRPGAVFPGGSTQIRVDAACSVHPLVSADLERIARRRVASPGLTYQVVDGRLKPLGDLLEEAGRAQEMLVSARRDLPVATQLGHFRAEGATALAGLVRADVSGLDLSGSDRKKGLDLIVVAQAVTEDGRVAAADDRRVRVPVDQAGGALASYRLTLVPGRYTLRYGVFDSRSGKGGTASEAVDVPDLDSDQVSVGSLMVARELIEGAQPDIADPLDAFVVGGLKVVPRFGDAFAPNEQVHFLYTVSGSRDADTGRADLTVAFSLARGTQIVASAPSQSFTDPHVVSSIGPVPLSYAPGTYTARLHVKDNLSGKDSAAARTFEIE